MTHNNLILNIEGADFEMIKVEGGRYAVGREPSNPTVILSDFWIGKFPVTQHLYQAIMGFNPSQYKNESNPVEQVNWQDCKLFIYQLNNYELVKKQNLIFRLPTEIEWEYAASDRGTSFYEYAGGNQLSNLGWFDENSRNRTEVVGLKKPNLLGLYDLNGNVWEWCEDDYDDNAYAKMEPEILNPVCVNGEILSLDNTLINNKERFNSSANKVNRGGSWRDGIRCCRLLNRDTYSANLRLNVLGFRLVCVIKL